MEKANYPIAWMCDQLNVPRSSFYAWRTRAGSLTATAARREALKEKIGKAFTDQRQVAGCRRIAAILNEAGTPCSVGLVGLPAGLAEAAQLGRSLWVRRTEILAYFDTGASNGPVEAINGRLEHLRGIALGFRNLRHYILRSLIHSGGLAEHLHAL
ncbi:hypothetical protein GOHSU_48_00110 [Gordonia hirsuta DSM 44140 = NBRC 16056]|uniref:Transposase IS204/IS1001/IS1096/IS1165 DDE domain-containing protein n=1 Tax=Gordonia hirsuta DSM 44140 = NBRC 16056 TaxID=1121927 RepID=L7LF94_9ACTN|nr:hypothetical protein GOHSU_48_00110 [Gordonia hirsuta DSM 44140 = NBRC 16056]